jgi:small-conductance mechanosensitive channel
MIRNPVTTITRYPIRRMDLTIGVAYKEDVGKVMEVLKDLAAANPYVLDEPTPLILFDAFGESSLNFRFGLWFEKSNFLKLRNSIMQDIKVRFDAEGIEIPFPHITLYSGSQTAPFPVEQRGASTSS